MGCNQSSLRKKNLFFFSVCWEKDGNLVEVPMRGGDFFVIDDTTLINTKSPRSWSLRPSKRESHTDKRKIIHSTRDVRLAIDWRHPRMRSSTGYIGYISIDFELDNQNRVSKLKLGTIWWLENLGVPKSIPTYSLLLQHLEELKFEGIDLRLLPRNFGNLNLKRLHLIDNKAEFLPSSIGNWSCLEELTVSRNPIWSLPDTFWSLTALRILRLEDVDTMTLSSDIALLQNLKDFSLKGLRRLKLLGDDEGFSLPSAIANLNDLEVLWLYKTSIPSLPETFWDLPNLRILTIERSWISEIPSPIQKLKNLESLNLLSNNVQSVSRPFISDLSIMAPFWKLQTLEIHCNGWQFYSEYMFRDLLEFVGQLTNLRHFCLDSGSYSGSHLVFPPSMEELKELRQLWMNGYVLSNALREPWNLKMIGKLSNLMVLRAPLSRWEDIEYVVKTCPHLGSVIKPEKRFLNRSHAIPELGYALLDNRFRCRWSPCLGDQKLPFFYKLWPNLLSNANSSFKPFPVKETRCYHDSFPEFEMEATIDRHDALYKILSDGRETFIQMLLHRNSYDESMSSDMQCNV